VRRIVKIGGSLLTRDDLVPSVNHWLAHQAPAENVVIVGGGALIDAIRQLDAVRPGDGATVHWRCIELLGTTFQIAADWFPGWDQVKTRETFLRGVEFGFSSSRPTIINVGAFYHANATQKLPLDWRTTTDSIAVLLGNLSHADEVTLLKSCFVDPEMSVQQLARDGIIDEAVPGISRRFETLRVVQLPAVEH
jgi:aspartokinase-like uncharacterized kinase